MGTTPNPQGVLGIPRINVLTPKPPTAQSREHHSIACMEVWGGSAAFRDSVVPGHDVQVACTT